MAVPIPLVWSADMLGGSGAAAPAFMPRDVVQPLPGYDCWDFWPVETPDGTVAAVERGALWIALTAPVPPLGVDHPDLRHAAARMRLFHVVDGHWRDLGRLLPEPLSPGSREWSGSAWLEAGRLTLAFTAAGRHGEASPTFEQRLFTATARLGPGPVFTDWTRPTPLVRSDGRRYAPAAQATGNIGAIEAFRDPAPFADPADGRRWCLFTATLGNAAGPHAGAVGLARAEPGGGWTLCPPLVTANGVNTELERPHVRAVGGRYYLFWSTQASVFAPGLPPMPTGLYAAHAPALLGPWLPVNGSGLVFGNPPAAPGQAYSWWVEADLGVTAFADHPGARRGAERDRATFVGGLAPRLRLRVRADRVEIA